MKKLAVIIACLLALMVGNTSAQELDVIKNISVAHGTGVYDDNSRCDIVTINEEGDFVIAWHSNESSNNQIYVRIFDKFGNPATEEIGASESNPGNGDGPSVASCGNGVFVVVWVDPRPEDETDGVFGQFFDELGTPIGVNQRFDEYDPTPPIRIVRPRIAWRPDLNQDGHHWGICTFVKVRDGGTGDDDDLWGFFYYLQNGAYDLAQGQKWDMDHLDDPSELTI
jgi:hypothetical protein